VHHRQTAHPSETTITTALVLSAGALRAAIRPDLGASLAGLWFQDAHGEHAVMRSTEPGELASSRASACYPLLPYSNRIGYRRFRWHGHDHSTAPNFDDSPHSVHGVGWLRAWEVLAHDGHSATLGYTHVPDAHWPFAFAAQQQVELAADALTLRLSFTNTHATPQPVGLGWHPYFPKRPRSRIHAEVAARWEPDAAGLPVRSQPQAGIDGDVAHLAFDHCFDGWQGAARLRDERLSLRLSSSATRLVVYTPETKPYYCVEPVTHVSNAIHMAEPLVHGLVALMPGERTEAWMRLEVASV
jgi:aldose 1-epimerase